MEYLCCRIFVTLTLQNNANSFPKQLNQLTLLSPEKEGSFWSTWTGEFLLIHITPKMYFRSFFNFYFNWRLITLQYGIGFAIHWHESATGVHVLTPLPPLSPSHPSGSSQCTSPEHPVSYIEPGLAIHFTYDNIHVSMPFSQIIPPSPSPTESKRLFYTSVSLLLSCIQGYHYHLSKFHIYALVYCIGVF